MTGSNSFWLANPSTGFYPEEIEQSLRFDGSTSKLEKTPSSDGNRKKWTSSWWVKRSKLGALQYMWSGASYSGNNGIAALYFNSDDKIHMYFDSDGLNPYGAINSRVYRDTTNWYHIVWAVDAANGVAKVWVNGVEETNGINPPNYDYGMNKASTKMAFGIASWGGSPDYSGYLAEFVHLDGQYLDETSFGEFKNGVWVPKNIDNQSFTFGTNGFYLPFSDSSNIGYDYQTSDRSGTTNDYTPTGLDSTDVLLDTCTKNYATMNVLLPDTNTYQEGNLKSALTTDRNSISTIAMPSGKWYTEFRCAFSGNINVYVGVFKGTNNYTYPWNYTRCINQAGGGYAVDSTYQSAGTYGTFSNTDIIGVYYDSSNGQVKMQKSDGSGGVTLLATITDANYVGEDVFFAYNASLGAGASGQVDVNFGQNGTFNNAVTAGGNSDDNNEGNFFLPVPSGFLALCSSNLSDTTLSPNQAEQADDYFNTITYTGDNATSRSLTGVGFQPDWIWYKDRTNTYGHVTYDSSRGTGENHLRIDGGVGSGTLAEGGYNDLYGTLTSFDSDGITIAKGDDTSAPSAFFNTNSASMVGWNWKCNGGTTSSNTDGDITSTVQVNTTAGFSIVTFTGNGTNGSTVGHGLGVKPAWYIVKDRDTNSAGHWMVWHQGFSDVDNNLFMNLNNGVNNGGFGTGDPTTTTTFEPASTTYTNNSGSRYVAYVFAEVEGYSKFGTYAGNGLTDGTFVYTGFRPAWIMFKRTDSADNWAIFDVVRDTFNPLDSYLYADSGASEATFSTALVDYLSNGFKWRGAVNFGNNSSGTYIYMAFAEQPFKFSNAR